MISPLAKGADWIVADGVLKRDRAKLKAILPFSIEEYSKDFDDPTDLAEFQKLLKKDTEPIVLGMGNGKTQSENEIQQKEMSKKARDEGYLKVGHSVADACEILIAIWDGKEARGTGGTAEVVQFAVDQARMVIWINSESADSPMRKQNSMQGACHFQASFMTWDLPPRKDPRPYARHNIPHGNMVPGTVT